MGELIIDAKHLGRVYPGKVPTTALKDVSLSVSQGEFVAIMGKSGSGKSTLLHCLGLLDSPTDGTLTIHNRDALKMTDHEKTEFRLTKLGYIFQEYAVLSELTALENVYLPASLNNGGSAGDGMGAARDLLKRVEMEHRFDHYPAELSGGEQQRVAIARALVNKPLILFADEPCANLDSESSEMVLRLLSEINRSLGQTIVMVTHEPEDRKWVDRIVWLKDGAVEKTEKVRKKKNHSV